MVPLFTSIQATKSSSSKGTVVSMILVTEAHLAAILADDNSVSFCYCLVKEPGAEPQGMVALAVDAQDSSSLLPPGRADLWVWRPSMWWGWWEMILVGRSPIGGAIASLLLWDGLTASLCRRSDSSFFHFLSPTRTEHSY